MSLKFDGTTIAPSYTVKYNDTSLKKIIYNGTTVWTKEQTLTGTYFHWHGCGDESEVDVDGTISIAFDTAFSSNPTVTLTFENKKYCTYSISQVTKTGFKIYWTQTTGNSKYIEKCYIHWTAVGEV